MKKKLSILISLLLGGACALSACASPATQADETSVLLDYGVGINEKGEYNRDLYYANQHGTLGADPGVFYVSEEDDPEYGGYYYMYITGWGSGDGGLTYAFNCSRSKDLVNWEPAGAYNGSALKVEGADWCGSDFWAPEVIYSEAEDLYYMYFSATAKNYASSTAFNPYGFTGQYDTMNLGIAVGETPVDFHMLGAQETVYNLDGEKINRAKHSIDFTKNCNVKDEDDNPLPFAAIDPSAFIDDDGTLYLYFCKQPDSNPFTPQIRGVWGMKMKDFVTPDYSTLTYIAQPSRTSVIGGYSEEKGVWYEMAGGRYDFDEGGVNEGPFMMKHAGKYYLTYSGQGYGSPFYSVHQAISTSPLGQFTKPQIGEGNPVLSSTGSYVAGTAHHCFVPAGEEIMIVYHRHGNPTAYGDGWNARMISVDKTSYIYKEGFGDLLASNGPSFNTLQWKPESVSGYKNLAQTAKVEVSNGTGVRYLNDGFVPSATFVEEMQYFSTGETTITLSWKEAVSVKSLMIYNSMDELYAFSNVDEIRFYFAEQPAWAKKSYTYGLIQGLKFDDKYVSQSANSIYYPAAAVAEINELKVNKITVTLKDKYETEDALGDPLPSIGVSEIVVLGK